ncbi:hypothetical protein R1sor_005723 [Riccia sorocarpa]|uniref:BAG family molecular chaperone regulator 4 n=1 Tax=Riccia sorocarpa TaxID=122646 RepID=A0ABD3HKM5_9MARC
MSKPGLKGVFSGSAEQEQAIDWELRPGGMLVQKRDPDAVAAQNGPMIKVKVSHGLFSHDISIPAQATFGDLKKLLVQDTNLQPNEQRLLFRGKQKEDSELLHVCGVKDKAKIILVEDPASRERRMEEMRKQEQIAKACKAIEGIRAEVDKLAGQISELEGNMKTGVVTHESEFVVLTELLMRQLLKLDGIQADGQAKELRRTEVKRVQGLVEALDGMKVRNSQPHAYGNSVVVTTQWETFDSGMGSLSAPPPPISTFTDWEKFD